MTERLNNNKNRAIKNYIFKYFMNGNLFIIKQSE